MQARHILARIAFAFMLLSQQLGFMHAISHLSAQTASDNAQKKSLPGELRCEQCLAFAAVGPGLTAEPPVPAFLPSPLETAAAPTPAGPFAARPRPFDTRAPPFLI